MGQGTRSHAKDGYNAPTEKKYDNSKTFNQKDPWVIDQNLLNEWEKTGCYDNLEFNPLSMKQFIDAWIDNGYHADENGWKLRKAGPLLKVWTNTKLPTKASSIPILRVEHYFPDVDDPMLIFLAMNEYRQEWDSEAASITDFVELANQNTYCKQIVLKPVLKSYSRELLEKRFFFQSQRALDMSENAQEELGTGFADDVYEYLTSMPDNVMEKNKNYVRADTPLGMNRIGRMTNRPPKTSNAMPENRGCYTCFVSQNDMKTGQAAFKLILPVIHIGIESWGKSFRNYLTKNMDRLRADLERRK